MGGVVMYDYFIMVFDAVFLLGGEVLAVSSF